MVVLSGKLENYTVRQADGAFIVYDTTYEANTLLLILAAALSVFVPDARDIKIPLALEIHAGADQNVIVYDDLSVQGSEDYSYFIFEDHYRKWNITYFLLYRIIFLWMLAIDTLFAYLTVANSGGSRIIVGCILIVFAIFTYFLAVKIHTQMRIKEKYPFRQAL
ncbi:MAG: hypothetical protein LBQ21_05430 [Clostridiales Family XIII bacterium]|jgi:hypothetical protein|nr:hypothetical protein [Clostridiales Family XIII bacterium]